MLYQFTKSEVDRTNGFQVLWNEIFSIQVCNASRQTTPAGLKTYKQKNNFEKKKKTNKQTNKKKKQKKKKQRKKRIDYNRKKEKKYKKKGVGGVGVALIGSKRNSINVQRQKGLTLTLLSCFLKK